MEISDGFEWKMTRVLIRMKKIWFVFLILWNGGLISGVMLGRESFFESFRNDEGEIYGWKKLKKERAKIGNIDKLVFMSLSRSES